MEKLQKNWDVQKTNKEYFGSNKVNILCINYSGYEYSWAFNLWENKNHKEWMDAMKVEYGPIMKNDILELT